MFHREFRKYLILACVWIEYLSEWDLMISVGLLHLIINEVSRCLRQLGVLCELYVYMCIVEIRLRQVKLRHHIR
jgi:hypothetical protein